MTLAPALYEVYVMILGKRLEREIEEKNSGTIESNGLQKRDGDNGQCLRTELLG